MSDIEKFNRQTPREEIFNAISHGLGGLLAIAGTPVLIVYAAMHGDALSIVSASLYGASMILLYLFSTLYHAITNVRGKRVMQVFDHCSIFVLILGTYIPVTLSLIRGWLGWTIFGINAGLAVLGVVLNAVSVRKFHKFSIVLYLLMGWSILPAINILIARVDVSGFLLALAGGLLYTVGVYFYKKEGVRYTHFVWHLLVIGGSACFYFFVLLYCLAC